MIKEAFQGGSAGLSLLQLALVPVYDFSARQEYKDLTRFLMDGAAVPECPSGIDTRELPDDCREVAETPRDLFEKLDQWGYASMVIPHGTTWGFYTPPAYAVSD